MLLAFYRIMVRTEMTRDGQWNSQDIYLHPRVFVEEVLPPGVTPFISTTHLVFPTFDSLSTTLQKPANLTYLTYRRDRERLFPVCVLKLVGFSFFFV